MKLYGVTLYNYFGDVFKTVYFSSKEEAERLADSWEHFTEIKGKTVEDVVSIESVDLWEKEPYTSYYLGSSDATVYFDSYDQLELYRANGRARLSFL